MIETISNLNFLTSSHKLLKILLSITVALLPNVSYCYHVVLRSVNRKAFLCKSLLVCYWESWGWLSVNCLYMIGSLIWQDVALRYAYTDHWTSIWNNALSSLNDVNGKLSIQLSWWTLLLLIFIIVIFFSYPTFIMAKCDSKETKKLMVMVCLLKCEQGVLNY